MRSPLARFLVIACLVGLSGPALAEESAPPHLARFAAGSGPAADPDGTLRLLDTERTPLQSNAAAFDRAHEGRFESRTLRCRLRVLEGGDGGAFLFLDTRRHGIRGPAPFVPSWTEPNVAGALAVGIDVHNPKTEEPFGPFGNYLGRPEREVSLHFDGREIVKRVAPVEFRGAFVDVEIHVEHVVGGAEVTVALAGEKVYDRAFVAELHPYEARLAIGAGTRARATTTFDVKDIAFEVGAPAAPHRPPLHVEVFNHVLTDNAKTTYEAEVDLPPLEWALGRIILTLEIHDAGPDWDEWDRDGEVSVFDDEGTRLGIVPFITSYRTECHWKVDVTHFRPLLTGRRKFEIRAGTTFYKNRGYMMSVSLDYHHGAPELEPHRVIPLWHGRAKYGDGETPFAELFTPRRVTIDAEATAGRIFTTVTGHSQVGEFTPSERTLTFVPTEGEPLVATDRLWKTDCYLNPNRPQAGTWKYARAGWAPGDVVRPWWIDVSDHLVPGEAEVRYVSSAYAFPPGAEPPGAAEIAKANQIVRSYLILWRPATSAQPAPVLRLVGVGANGNAARAGLLPGDYLERYEGRRIDRRKDLVESIQAASAAGKAKVRLVVWRGLERMEVELDAGRMGVNVGH